MKTFPNIKLTFLAIVVVPLIQFGCQKSNNTPSYEVKITTSTTLGPHLVDKNGNTLYTFANDFNGRSSCLGGCAALWPPFYDGSLTQANLDPSLNISDFDTIQVNGVAQTRYKTWPLYYYAPMSYNQNVRESPGQTSGEGFANLWFVAKSDYSIMFANEQLVGSNGIDYTSAYVPGTGKSLYFTDAKGVTLYTFTKDSANINRFTKSDFSNNSIWPIYETKLGSVPSVLDKSLFGTTNVFGHMQLTYKGWPLYYFGSDNSVKGNNKGVSFPVVGIWHVAAQDIPEAPVR
jgi:predicted lipoprotein with Yx(FWY)xxD motif